MNEPEVVIIGAGNVATHLARALDKKCHVAQVCSRTMAHSAALAEQLTDCVPLDDTSKITPNANFYIIAASDDSIASIASAMPKVNGIVAHTSGSVPMDALKPASSRIGVFYPLQTFSKSAAVDMSVVPFFTEASDAESLAALDSLAYAISGKVNHANSRQRAILHIAAVFACNFANRLWAISDDILKANGYSLDVLSPLLSVTLDKAMHMPPAEAQTGPAARGDLAVINKHLSMLDAENKAIYNLLSDSIMSAAKHSHADTTNTK